MKTTLDITALIGAGKIYLVRRFDETHVKDTLTNETLLVYATRNGATITYDRIEDPVTKQISWMDPTKNALSPLVETSHTPYSVEVISTLLERMTEGESLTKICKDVNMPKYSQLVRWMRVHPWIKQAIEDARLARAEYHRDKVLEEAERAESYKDPIQATQVKIAANQWLASVDDSRYKNNAKVEANINIPTQIIVHTGINRNVEKDSI